MTQQQAGQRQAVDHEWMALADLDPSQRDAKVEAWFIGLAALPEEQRRARLLGIALADCSLPDGSARELTLSRLRAWLKMDPQAAMKVASSFDAVMDNVPADHAIRRVAIAQSAVQEFSTQERERLRELLPRVFSSAVTKASSLAPSCPLPQGGRGLGKKPFWRFWDRR